MAVTRASECVTLVAVIALARIAAGVVIVAMVIQVRMSSQPMRVIRSARQNPAANAPCDGALSRLIMKQCSPNDK